MQFRLFQALMKVSLPKFENELMRRTAMKFNRHIVLTIQLTLYNIISP